MLTFQPPKKKQSLSLQLWCRTGSSTCKDQKVILSQDGVMMRSFDQFDFYRADININRIEWICCSGRALIQETLLKGFLSDLKQVHFYTCYFLLLETCQQIIMCIFYAALAEHWICREGRKGERAKATYFNARGVLVRENQWFALNKIIQDQCECWRMHSECQRTGRVGGKEWFVNTRRDTTACDELRWHF